MGPCGTTWDRRERGGTTLLLSATMHLIVALDLSKHVQDYDHFNLEVGYEDGRDRVLLWLPTICKHVITDESPLASWLKPSGIMADADATIIVVVSHLLAVHAVHA